jgi:hypothetical protein
VATGNLDLIVQVTWVTMFFDNIGNATHPFYNFRADRPLSISSNLNFYGKALTQDMDGDGE